MSEVTRIMVEVVTLSNRALGVEFRVRSGTVEVWSTGLCRGVFLRDRVQAWLGSPSRWLRAGEVVLSVDPRRQGERIALGLPEVGSWTLSPGECAATRDVLCGATEGTRAEFRRSIRSRWPC